MKGEFIMKKFYGLVFIVLVICLIILFLLVVSVEINENGNNLIFIEEKIIDIIENIIIEEKLELVVLIKDMIVIIL